jgi:hypothetical protein
VYIARSVTLSRNSALSRALACSCKLRPTPPPATPPIPSRSTTHNAATGTPQLGLIAPATISNTLARPSRTTQCRHPSAFLHKHSRHQIYIRSQARPLCAPPRCTSSQLHSDGSTRTKSAFNASTHRPPGAQARHDCSLRPRNRETHTLHGYWAVQIGAGQKEPRNVTRPLLGHFAQAGVSPKRHLAEFKVKDGAGLALTVGETVGANWFAPGQWVDVRGTSRGMGFAGVGDPGWIVQL